MTTEEKKDIIELLKSFKPFDLNDDDNKRVAQVVDEITNAIDGMADTKN